MHDNRNLIIAFLASLVILLVFDVFVMRPQREAAQQQMEAQEAMASASAEQDGALAPTLEGGASADVPDGGPNGGMMAGGLRSREAAVNAVARVPLLTPKLTGTVSLKGGRLDDLILTDYRVSLKDDAPPVTLLSPAGAQNAYFADFGWVGQPGVSPAVPTSQTVWSPEGDRLSPDAPLTLTWDNGEGLVFTRTFEVDENYMFTVTQTVRNAGGAPVTLAPYGLVSRHGTPETSKMFILHEGALAVLGEELREIDYSDLQEQGRMTGEATGGWLGFTDKYWLTALVPGQENAYKARFSHRTKDGQDRYQVDFLLAERTIAPGETVSVESRVFAGAKVVELLDEYEQTYNIARFDLGVDWGWFYWITKPIFYSLHYMHDWFGNFGLAILALTVVLKLVFFPLANKSYRAMSKMKLMQPKMQQLKERYGDDKVRMQQEMMELYKKEQINPLAGCLPILVQIPVFFALYKVLFVTLEMRHAPFYLWVKDLSAPDTLTPVNLFGLIPWDPPGLIAIGVWPILMGLTMYLQQKLNPAPQDPVQAKVLAFLPLIFTFILAQFAVGLVIYWTWNNVLSIAQQWVIMKRMGVPVEPK